MKIYEYIPAKNRTRTTGLIIILCAIAAAFFSTPLLFPDLSFKGVFQFVSVICLVGAIFIIARYVAKTFVYSILQNDDGSLDLTVCELTNGNRKRTTVCRVGINNFTEVHLLYPEKSADRIKEKEICANARSEHRKMYDYCHDIKATPICIILLEECGEPLLIKLSPDETLMRYLEIKA